MTIAEPPDQTHLSTRRAAARLAVKLRRVRPATLVVHAADAEAVELLERLGRARAIYSTAGLIRVVSLDSARGGRGRK